MSAFDAAGRAHVAAQTASVSAPFAGRTALVTGGGNGLGRAIAFALLDHGARVVVVGRRPEPLAETCALAGVAGERCRSALVDVADPASVAQLAEQLRDETIDILINNAGIAGPVKPLIEVEPEEWDEVFATNVRGMFLVCRAFLPPMIERGSGNIINLASVSGKRPLALRTPYTASKMAVIGLTTTLAAEVGVLGITVNSLSPGPVRGPRMERNFRLDAERLGITAEQSEQNYVSRATLGRLIEEAEVGQAVVSMLQMPGLHAADIDLSAGMVAR